jgi:hypothetical protein
MSAFPPVLPVRSESKPATLGTAIHFVAQFFLKNHVWPDVLEVARKYNVNEDELLRLFYALRDAMQEVLKWGRVVHFEEQFKFDRDGLILTGSPDLILKDDETGQYIIVDWKSGYIQSNHIEQMKGYGILLREKYDLNDAPIKSAIVWLRSKEIEVEEFSTGPRHIIKLLDLIVKAKEYNVTSHCYYCPRANECPAREEELKGAANTLIEVNGAISTEKMIGLYDKAKLLEKALDTYKDRLRELLSAGPVFDNGRIFEVKEIEIKRLKTQPTYAKLIAEIGPSIVGMMNFDKKKLTKYFGDTAPGGKGEYIKKRMAELEESDCFIKSIQKKISVKKGKPNE